MHSPPWKIIDTGIASALQNMETDRQLLDNLACDSSQTLHFYEWEKPSLTYGHFTDPAILLNMQTVDRLGLDLARRPTGGGITFHMSDFAFSIFVPASHPHYSVNTLDNYAYVNRMVVEVLEKFLFSTEGFSLQPVELPNTTIHADHFCLAKPTKYDVIFKGKKLSGGAQRRTKKGFLHQGSITLCMPDTTFLNDILFDGFALISAMTTQSTSLLDHDASPKELFQAKKQLREIFIETVHSSL